MIWPEKTAGANMVCLSRKQKDRQEDGHTEEFINN